MEILTDTTVLISDRISVQRVEIACPQERTFTSIGIDPGTVHFGLAILCAPADGGKNILYEVTLSRQKDAMDRMRSAQAVLHCLRMLDGWSLTEDTQVVIEGASFADRYRQAELAEQRAACGLFFHANHVEAVYFVPPTTIMKKVMGKGNKPAWKEWPHLPHNAASALACAIYSLTSV